MSSPPERQAAGAPPAPPTDPADVALWYARVPEAIDPSLRAAYEDLLQPDEAQRCGRLRFERLRVEYLLTRALARAVLSEYEPVAPRAWRFAVSARGRPELDPPRGELRFNLSNCAALVVCAVARGREVGVDAEPYARGASILGLAARVFSAREREGLERLPAGEARAARAVSLWTLKESYVKASGVGLSIPLPSLSFEEGGGRVVLSVDGAPERSRAFLALDLEGHRVAVTAGPPGGPAALRVFETTPLVSSRRRPDLDVVGEGARG